MGVEREGSSYVASCGGKRLPGGKHKTKKQARAHLAAVKMHTEKSLDVFLLVNGGLAAARADAGRFFVKATGVARGGKYVKRTAKPGGGFAYEYDDGAKRGKGLGWKGGNKAHVYHTAGHPGGDGFYRIRTTVPLDEGGRIAGEGEHHVEHMGTKSGRSHLGKFGSFKEAMTAAHKHAGVKKSLEWIEKADDPEATDDEGAAEKETKATAKREERKGRDNKPPPVRKAFDTRGPAPVLPPKF